MRAVTLTELAAWVEKNKLKHSWNPEAFKSMDSSLRMKYVDFSFDTRDMVVWKVEIKGPGRDLWAREDNENDGRTILDALDELLNQAGSTSEDKSE